MGQNSERALKFTPLSPAPGFLSRPRLYKAIAGGLQGRLVLVVAPAGYGKTSLLALVASDWHRFADNSTTDLLAWYRLDHSDDDAAIFLDGLVSAVERVVPGFGTIVRAALQTTGDARGEIQRLMSLFLGELRRIEPRRVFLLLDGLQCLTDRVIVETLERALLDPTSPLRAIIATRLDPRFYLSVLRSRGELTELGVEDLQWTSEELRQLAIDRAGRPVPQKILEDLVRATGGWPSAANLASLIVARDLSSQSFGKLAPTEHGYGVLLRELLAGMPAESQQEVLRSSLLVRLDPESCLEGVGVRDPEGLLRLVEKSRLPTMRPEGLDLPIYYEPLFGLALRQELARCLLPREYQSLQRRTAGYYAARGETAEAMARYLEMGSYEEAATLLEECIEEELSCGHLDQALRWLRALPATVRERRPRLMVQEAELLLVRNRLDEARVLLVAAEPLLEASGTPRDRGEQLTSWAAAHLLEGRPADARVSAQKALLRLPETDHAQRAEACWLQARSEESMGYLASASATAEVGLLEAERSQLQPLIVRALVQLGMIASLRGDYSRALGASGRAVQRSALLGTQAVVVSAVGAMASSIYLELGHSLEALQVAGLALEAGEKLQDQSALVQTRLSQASSLERLGRGQSSREALAQAGEIVGSLLDRHQERSRLLQATAVELFRQGRRKDGLENARKALEAAGASMSQPLIDQCRLFVAAWEMTGLKAPLVLARIRRLNEAFRRTDNRRWLSAGHLLLAQGYGRLGLTGWARSHLRSALVLAAEQSWVGAPPGLPLRPEKLLQLAVREGVAHEVAGTLLGVGAANSSVLLAPLLRQENPQLRTRAEQALKGIEKGLGMIPPPKLVWPGIPPDGAGDVPSVALYSLGGLQGSAGGQTVEWPSVDSRNLAAYLLVHRTEPLPREAVLSGLWPGEDQAAANVRLHQALYQLRESLGPGYPPVDPLLDGEGVYRWDGECFIDAERFRELLGRVRLMLRQESPPALRDQVISVLEEALELYQGEFLTGFPFGWCEAPREELRKLLLWSTRLLIDHYMALARWRDAIRCGLKSLKSDPLQEDVVRDLMACNFRVGDRAAVDYQYREIKRLLARERGVWPSEETRQLRLKLLGGAAGWARGASMEPTVLVVGNR